MSRRTRKGLVGVFAAAILAIAAVAVADIMGSSSLADLLGTGGANFGHVRAGMHTSGSTPREELIVFGQKDTSQSPVGIAGSISYSALNDTSAHFIHRIVYEVSDPSVGGWTTIKDVTQPDARISNAPGPTGYNTFTDTYTHANMSDGIYYRVRVFPSSTGGAAVILESGFHSPN